MPAAQSVHAQDGPGPSELSDLVVFSHLRWPWVWQRPQRPQVLVDDVMDDLSSFLDAPRQLVVRQAFATVVDLEDDDEGFASACREVLHHDLSERDRKLRPLLDADHWDTIATEMASLVAEAVAPARPLAEVPA